MKTENTPEFWNSYLTTDHRKPVVVDIMIHITEIFYQKLDNAKSLSSRFEAGAGYGLDSITQSAAISYERAIKKVNKFSPYKIEYLIDNYQKAVAKGGFEYRQMESVTALINICANIVDGAIPFHEEEFNETLGL